MNVKLKNRDFFDEDHYKLMLQDYEAIRVSRKNRKGKPDEYDRIILNIEKMFEEFYKQFLD
jgi:hypothetical protein